MTILEVDAVSRRFGGVTALDNVSFSVDAGEILGLMGANGAGKTTLFALIAGNLRPSSGRIRLDGRIVSGRTASRVNAMGIARTFQIVRPFVGLSVRDNVMAGALYGRGRARGMKLARDQADAILDDMQMLDRADMPAGELTLAGRKRLEIARALATKPRVLLLDEVMAGLTATEVTEALTILERLRNERGLTLVVIEHVMKALMRLSDRIVVLHHGEKIAEGAPTDIADNEKVAEVYFGASGKAGPHA